MDEQESTANDAAAEEEEEMLRSTNPINLFGAFAPPALKEAQKMRKRLYRPTLKLQILLNAIILQIHFHMLPYLWFVFLSFM